MNNNEKANALILKKLGFYVFWQYNGPTKGEFWATHPSLISQYAIKHNDVVNQAVEDLKIKVKKAIQLKLI